MLWRELNQARSKPDTVDRPVRTARIFVHHYNSTQYCNTETSFLYIPLPPDQHHISDVATDRHWDRHQSATLTAAKLKMYTQWLHDFLTEQHLMTLHKQTLCYTTLNNDQRLVFFTDRLSSCRGQLSHQFVYHNYCFYQKLLIPFPVELWLSFKFLLWLAQLWFTMQQP